MPVQLTLDNLAGTATTDRRLNLGIGPNPKSSETAAQVVTLERQDFLHLKKFIFPLALTILHLRRLGDEVIGIPNLSKLPAHPQHF